MGRTGEGRLRKRSRSLTHAGSGSVPTTHIWPPALAASKAIQCLAMCLSPAQSRFLKGLQTTIGRYFAAALQCQNLLEQRCPKMSTSRAVIPSQRSSTGKSCGPSCVVIDAKELVRHLHVNGSGHRSGVMVQDTPNLNSREPEMINSGKVETRSGF